MAKKLSPIELVIARFAEKKVTARALSREIGSDNGVVVLQWRLRKRIPSGPDGENYRNLLSTAKKHGVPLTADELINGGML